MRFWPVVPLALLACAPLAAQDLTGNWSGTYTFSIQLSACQNKTFSSSGNIAVTFLQTGGSIVGRADLTNDLSFSGTCSPASVEATHVLVGSAAPGTVTWHYPNDSNGTTFTGTISGNAISAQLTDANGGTGTVTLNRVQPQMPTVNTTGTWSGSYSFKDVCPNGGTTSYSGTFTLSLVQSGSTAAGVASMDKVPLYDQNCATIATLPMTMAAAGTVSGSLFSGSVFDPSGSFDFPISVTISGSGMSGTVSGASSTSTTGTFALTQSSAQPPASDFAGTYDGSYNETDNEAFTCINIGALNFGGAVSLSVVQSGNAVAGALLFQDEQGVSADVFGDCVVVNLGEQVLPLYGTLSNGMLTLQLPIGSGVTQTLTVNFTAPGASGTLVDSFGDQAAFTATKSASPPPPGLRRRAVHP